MRLSFKYFLLMSFLLLFVHSISAQDLIVRSMEQIPDATAIMNEYSLRYDDDSNYAGIVKVFVALDNVTFDGGGVLKQQKMDQGEYWVWMAKDSSRLMVRAPGFLPFEVNFRNYDGVNIIHSKKTYKLVLSYITSELQQQTIQTFMANGVSFNMIRVEGGTFLLGATDEQKEDASNMEKPAHSVKLDSYLMGETEVTQELWEAVMGNNPSYNKGSKNPVEIVSWDDCHAFLKKINALTGQSFRLPTEAEWEFAARGGIKTKSNKYAGGNIMDDVAWFMHNSGDEILDESVPKWDTDRLRANHCKSHPVGSKKANELGFYDMSGNVWEWCEDWLGEYESIYKVISTKTNPRGALKGSHRVIRGGSFNSYARSIRVSYRTGSKPDKGLVDVGLRLAL